MTPPYGWSTAPGETWKSPPVSAGEALPCSAACSAMLDPLSESPWESIMRVLHRAADIPVLVQQDVHDQYGQLIGRADLRIKGTRRLQEYDGEGHRERDQHADDLARDRDLLSGSWQRHGYVARDLLHGGAEIIGSVDHTLGREWDSRRLAAWQHLIKHSLYGRAGRARPYKRWRRATPEETATRLRRQQA